MTVESQRSADSTTLLDALAQALTRAGFYNSNDQVAPAAVLWPDKEGQWAPLLPALRNRLPLLTLGDHDPAQRRGSAYWLRCMLARVLPGGLPKTDLPIHVSVVRKGRCALLKSGVKVDQCVVPWHWNAAALVATAAGIACFEAGKEYEHGGVSPQECITPVVDVRR